MPYQPKGHARVRASRPDAFGICDICGFQYQLKDLRWVFQWSGFNLKNLGQLACPECWDKPQPQLRAIVIPPDPVPVLNPRPEFYSSEVPSYRTTESGAIRSTEAGEPRVTEGIEPI